jgi:ribosomal protein L11 methyltransferase
MSYLRLSLDTNESCIAPVSELLEKFAATAISFEAKSDEKIFAGVGEEPQFWVETTVSALLDSDIDIDILLACLRNRIGTENIYRHQIQPLEDKNWKLAHQHEDAPYIFANRLCVSTSWHGVQNPALVNVVLDPGLAFGSGSHPTTSLCLEWLANQQLEGLFVIDYGCGSGILSLAAASLGASEVLAVAIDPQAQPATENNDPMNKLSESISVIDKSAIADGKADILVANILLNPLKELSSFLPRLVKPGGRIVLSGILSTQVEDCLESYGQWFKMSGTEFKEEWALCCGTRNESPLVEMS